MYNCQICGRSTNWEDGLCGQCSNRNYKVEGQGRDTVNLFVDTSPMDWFDASKDTGWAYDYDEMPRREMALTVRVRG